MACLYADGNGRVEREEFKMEKGRPWSSVLSHKAVGSSAQMETWPWLGPRTTVPLGSRDERSILGAGVGKRK